jgi:uncharacterized membrane protein
MTLMSLFWAIAFGICPQRPSHSLFLGGQQMPIEARMAGMFGGFLFGVAYIAARGRGRALCLPGRSMTLLLLGFGVLLGADGLNALFFDLGLPHLYTPYNPIRLATGLLTGLTMAAFLVPTFNSTLWQTGLDVSPLTSLGDVLGAIALEAVYFVAALSGSSLLWYPVSLLAVLGVPAVMGLIGALVATAATGRTNRATRLSQILPLVLGGLLIAAVFLLVTSGVRLTLFGAGPMDLPMRGLVK